MQRMAGREIRALAALNDRQRKKRGELHERLETLARASGSRRQHDGPLAANEMLRDVSQRIRIARTQSRRSRQCGRWLLHVSDFGHQHFARQREVDRPGWIARGDLQRAGDDFAHLLRPA